MEYDKVGDGTVDQSANHDVSQKDRYSFHTGTNLLHSFKIIVISLSGLWDFWLGRGTTIVTGIRKVWEVQYPPGVPEATQRVHNLLRHRDEI